MILGCLHCTLLYNNENVLFCVCVILCAYRWIYVHVRMYPRYYEYIYECIYVSHGPYFPFSWEQFHDHPLVTRNRNNNLWPCQWCNSDEALWKSKPSWDNFGPWVPWGSLLYPANTANPSYGYAVAPPLHPAATPQASPASVLGPQWTTVATTIREPSLWP